MLENAGAIVYTPRERDTQKNEIIVDNDTPNASLYLEAGSKKARWTTTSVKGFAQKKAIYEYHVHCHHVGPLRMRPCRAVCR